MEKSIVTDPTADAAKLLPCRFRFWRRHPRLCGWFNGHRPRDDYSSERNGCIICLQCGAQILSEKKMTEAMLSAEAYARFPDPPAKNSVDFQAAHQMAKALLSLRTEGLI